MEISLYQTSVSFENDLIKLNVKKCVKEILFPPGCPLLLLLQSPSTLGLLVLPEIHTMMYKCGLFYGADAVLTEMIQEIKVSLVPSVLELHPLLVNRVILITLEHQVPPSQNNSCDNYSNYWKMVQNMVSSWSKLDWYNNCLVQGGSSWSRWMINSWCV